MQQHKDKKMRRKQGRKERKEGREGRGKETDELMRENAAICKLEVIFGIWFLVFFYLFSSLASSNSSHFLK